MNPLSIAGLGLGGLGALGGLAGLTHGPSYEQLMQMLTKFAGPQALGRDTQQLYQQGLGSAGFQNQLQGINLAGNLFNQNYAAGQAQQGFGGDTVRSGIGNVGSYAAPGLSSMHRGQAYGNLYNQSQQMAMQNLMARLQALQQMHPGNTFGQQFGNLLGAGMQGGGDYLMMRGMRTP